MATTSTATCRPDRSAMALLGDRGPSPPLLAKGHTHNYHKLPPPPRPTPGQGQVVVVLWTPPQHSRFGQGWGQGRQPPPCSQRWCLRGKRLFGDHWSQAHHPWDLQIPLGKWFLEFASQWSKVKWLLSRGYLSSSRPAQLATHGPSVWMNSGAISLDSANLVKLVQTSYRPLCHSVQSSPACVCVLSSRSSNLGGRCSVHSLFRSPDLCLPLIRIIGKVLEGKRRQGHPHSNGLSLANPGLVSRASPSLPCSTHQASTGPSVSSAVQVRVPNGNPGGCTFMPGFCAGLTVFTRSRTHCLH